MPFDHSVTQAAQHLKQAVPLMVKYSIPATPENYALWYHYVAGNNPTLQRAVDQVITKLGSCPDWARQQISADHLAEEDNPNDISQHVSDLVDHLINDVADVASGAGKYNEVLHKTLNQLPQTTTLDPNITSLISTITEQTERFIQTTDNFNDQLSDAQKEISQLRSELKSTRKDIFLDSLTGVYNRRAFDLQIKQLLDCKDNTFTLILIDLDHFKAINDNHGHVLGDKVLQSLGKLLQNLCKEMPRAIASRYGGEEFALTVTGASIEESKAIAETLRNKIASLKVVNANKAKQAISISASFGIATRTNADTKEQLVDRADTALYLAKQLGRNQVKTESDISNMHTDIANAHQQATNG